MVTAEQLAARRDAIAASPDLAALGSHLETRNAPVIERLPPIPEVKALLSVDGGRCPDDGSALVFDPWSPEEHACPACGKRHRGERHTRAWAKLQHLWLAERAAELAALAALTDHSAGPAAARSAEILRAYGERYFRYPNRDNVLGPSRLFFSTYLESIWLLNYLAAAALLREAGHLDEPTARAVWCVADEAANLIGEHDEGYSNRQTWNDAALCAIAVWFEDEGLARRAVQGETGLIAQLRGYRDDGMWYEGENYHLFALRGMLTGAGWAAQAGVDFFGEQPLAEALAAALRAPTLSALPDLTFPARKDARFGVSLAQPMSLELWEVGVGRLPSPDLAAWLRALYGAPAQRPELFESYLHDAPMKQVPPPPSRQRLSWWALLEMAPQLPESAGQWSPRSVFMAGQGLAILRSGDRYVSLECGPPGGGHGHADRLNLTVHAHGVHWLPDFGTGSYVARELFWYRSTLAHNAPRLDEVSQRPGEARAGGFDERQGWGWARGQYEALTRTIVMGEHYLLDLLELAGHEERLLELPWHFAGRGEVQGGAWESGELPDEFVTRVERFRPDASGPLVLELTADGRQLTAHFEFGGELLRAEAPGRSGDGGREPFHLLRVRGRNVRLVTVLEFGPRGRLVRGVHGRGELVEIETHAGTDRHRFNGRAWEIDGPAGRVMLGATATPPPRFETLLNLDPPSRPTGAAWRVDTPPALDGTPQGFHTTEPLRLEIEDQYRRSEEPYAGPDDFAAWCHANWDDRALYLAVEVVKPELSFRATDAPPLRLDNEPDDIHSDGLQVYLSGLDDGAGGATGFLIVPEPTGGRVRVRPVGGMGGDPATVRGAWRRTGRGYAVTLAIPWPEQIVTYIGGRIGFDLLVNEMLPGRERRAGQLVWSGGNGWIWLWGDRQDPGRFGVLELVG
ncbi:MAG: heparinase II/III domain-containing protein [Gemmatimonadales bacterium]